MYVNNRKNELLEGFNNLTSAVTGIAQYKQNEQRLGISQAQEDRAAAKYDEDVKFNKEVESFRRSFNDSGKTEYDPNKGSLKAHTQAMIDYARTMRTKSEIQKLERDDTLQEFQYQGKAAQMAAVEAGQLASIGKYQSAAQKYADSFDDFSPFKVDFEEVGGGKVNIIFHDVNGDASPLDDKAMTWEEAYSTLDKLAYDRYGVKANGEIDQENLMNGVMLSKAHRVAFNHEQLLNPPMVLTSPDPNVKPIYVRQQIDKQNSRVLVDYSTGQVYTKEFLVENGYGTPEQVNKILAPKKRQAEIDKLKSEKKAADALANQRDAKADKDKAYQGLSVKDKQEVKIAEQAMELAADNFDLEDPAEAEQAMEAANNLAKIGLGAVETYRNRNKGENVSFVGYTLEDAKKMYPDVKKAPDGKYYTLGSNGKYKIVPVIE